MINSVEVKYLPSFKAQVALAAHQNGQSLAALEEVANRFGITIEQVQQWERELIEGAANVFSAGEVTNVDEQAIPETASDAGEVVEANAKFRTFFEQGSYFAGVVTLDGILVEANRLCLAACGFTREDIIGKKLWDCGWWTPSPIAVETVRSGFRQAVSGRTFRQEMRYFIADGSERMADFVLTPVRDDRGEILFIASTGVEITERKQVEQQLRFLDRLSEANRSAADPKAIMEVTTRMLGQHLAATRCAYADLEADNDCFTIRDDWTVEGVASTVGVYSLSLFGSRAVANLRQGYTLVINDVDRELTPADGADMFNAIGVKAIICCPLVKEERLIALMAVHQRFPREWKPEEITLVEEVVDRSWAHIERVRATEALRHSETHLTSLFDQTAAGIAEMDMDGRLVKVNDRYCQILGRTREEIVSQSIHDFVYVDDVGNSFFTLQSMKETGKSVVVENRYCLPDGAPVWVSNTLSLISELGDKPAKSILAVVLDITDHKQAEEKLKYEDRRKDEFLAMLAHELRNPLAPIGVAADLLRFMPMDEARIRKTSEVIARQVRHMTDLVDDLLDVSRVTRGVTKLDRIALDIKRVVCEALEQVRPLMEARRHHLVVRLPKEKAFIPGDKKRMVQIITNLLSNAAKYTSEGGNIDLQMELHAEHVVFTVADNGIGMVEELAGRAFDLFAQAERTSDRSQGGLGIGLALVKSLVELHGGEVTAYSEGLGKGSRFTVSLPRLLNPVEDEAIYLPNEQLCIANKALKVMVVDDNIDAAQTLAIFAEALGHQVFVEHDSRRALERARQELPDVFLLDIGLPDMDGIELASRLRARQDTADAVLIAVTGYGQEQDRENAMNAGFNYHFVKPVNTLHLAKVLNEIGDLQHAV